jgi:glycosyltransferase involved in cell wall biosynthesis
MESKKDTICVILNYAPHYRKSIFEKMDAELSCDFYFGDNIHTAIKKYDTRCLKQSKELKTVWFFNYYCILVGSARLIFKPYKRYLLTGHIYCISNWLIMIMAKLLRKKIYIWNHGWYGKESVVRILINRIYYSFVTGFFLYGEFARDLMIQHGINDKKLNVVYNSLDYDKILSMRPRLVKSDLYVSRFKNCVPVIIFIGRLQPAKKLDMLIPVMSRMKRKGVETNLVLIGDGKERIKLERLVNDYSLFKNIWFYGPCYDEETIGMLLYNADLCISPGNVGLTGIHSLSFGTPVITHDDFSQQMPEFEAIIPGKTGSFYKAGDSESLEREIITWFSNHPEKNKEVVQACFNVIDEKYNTAYQMQIFKNVLGVSR